MASPLPDWKEKRIKKMLVDTNRTQKEIADAVGIHHSVVSKIKKKFGIKRDISITVIDKLTGKGLLNGSN